MQRANEVSNVTPQQITEDLWAFWRSQIIIAGIELEVFTHIASGKRTSEEIARAAKASKRGMERLLDALVALGYLNKKGDKYGLEAISEKFLVRSNQPYLGDMAYSSKLVWDTWSQLTEVVKSGRHAQAVDQETAGRDFFPKLVAGIFPMSYGAARAAAAAIPQKDLKRINKILDVAAGSGAWSLAFAQALPESRVTAVDFPEVTPITRQYAERFGVADQYDYVEGNLREIDFGRDRYDLIILGHIIHSEGEKWGKKLIKKCHRALSDGGMLLIAEMVPNDERSGPTVPLMFGLKVPAVAQRRGLQKSHDHRSARALAAYPCDEIIGFERCKRI
jgi:ubiquinone/menaquinone biosynthesis C-methylase UbiE